MAALAGVDKAGSAGVYICVCLYMCIDEKTIEHPLCRPRAVPSTCSTSNDSRTPYG